MNVEKQESFGNDALPFTGKCCDEGKSYLSEVPDSPATKAFKEIIQSKLHMCLTKKIICFCSNTYNYQASTRCKL